MASCGCINSRDIFYYCGRNDRTSQALSRMHVLLISELGFIQKPTFINRFSNPSIKKKKKNRFSNFFQKM
jgi:hypothetical protein